MNCIIDGCARTTVARGMCNAHYQRWRTHGDPLAGRLSRGVVAAEFERLAALETDECVIWPYATAGNRNYGAVSIGGRRSYTHALVLERRVGPRPDGHVAAHGPCNAPRCMNYRHLRWATHVENNADKQRDGTIMRGAACPAAKLTDDDVRVIRRRLASGETHTRIAADFKVAQSQISAINTGRQWRHVA